MLRLYIIVNRHMPCMNVPERVAHHVMLDVIEPRQMVACNGAGQLDEGKRVSSKQCMGNVDVHGVCFSDLIED